MENPIRLSTVGTGVIVWNMNIVQLDCVDFECTVKNSNKIHMSFGGVSIMWFLISNGISAIRKLFQIVRSQLMHLNSNQKMLNYRTLIASSKSSWSISYGEQKIFGMRGRISLKKWTEQNVYFSSWRNCNPFRSTPKIQLTSCW